MHLRGTHNNSIAFRNHDLVLHKTLSLNLQPRIKRSFSNRMFTLRQKWFQQRNAYYIWFFFERKLSRKLQSAWWRHVNSRFHITIRCMKEGENAKKIFLTPVRFVHSLFKCLINFDTLSNSEVFRVFCQITVFILHITQISF